MICTFVYSDNPAYEYDVKKALASSSTVVFFLEIARLDGDSFVGKGFSFELLDNEKWEIKTKQRTSLEIITLPNLLLHGYTLTAGINKGKSFNFRTLLKNWYYARSKWFYPGQLTMLGGTVRPETLLVKYVRGSDSLEFAQINHKKYLIGANIKIETANSA